MHVRNLAEGVVGLTSNVFHLPGETPALIDTGAGFDLVERIDGDDRIDAPEVVVLTHSHADHIENVMAVREAFDPVVLGFDPAHSFVDDNLDDGERLTLGEHAFEVLATPGHATDHVCLLADDGPSVLFSGDLIFPHGGVGRIDLPGCDPRALVESVRRVTERVDGSLSALYPGHGPTIEDDAIAHLRAARRTVGLD